MVNYADGLIAVWDGWSSGTAQMILEAASGACATTCIGYEGR